MTWKQLVLHPGRDYYAARAILTSVGCSRGRLAVLGSKSGGVHGTPRIRSWRQLPDGSLAAAADLPHEAAQALLKLRGEVAALRDRIERLATAA